MHWFPNVSHTCCFSQLYISSLISSLGSTSFPFQLYFILSGTKEGKIYPSSGECAGALSIPDAIVCGCVCAKRDISIKISKCLMHDH